MRQLFTLFIAILLTATLYAQSPEKMSYQAVIRNNSDALVISTQLGMRISILQASATGTAVYVETQTPTSNTNGLVSLEIGTGISSDDFSSIDWTNGPFFIKTETDLSGGVNYTITGTSQLLSVPFALHAKTAETLTGGITEADPVYTGSQAVNIDSADIINLGNLSGINSGDQDISGIATNEQAIQDTASQIRSDIPVVISGTQTGEMQYWNGTQWIIVAAGVEGQILSFIGGVPTWTTMVGATTVGLGDVYNPTTGKIWMDRNLGASQVATSSIDVASYGDLYQWGRGTDGHQIRTSTTTTILATSDTPGHGNFIKSGSTPHDWRSPKNDSLWQGVNGINNPCPNGYRLPTEAEWSAESQSWGSNNAAGAFGSPLKLTIAGGRDRSSASIFSNGYYGYYWSSTVAGDFSRSLYFFGSNVNFSTVSRAYGFSVRCIKD